MKTRKVYNKEYYAAHKEELKAYAREYRAAHREECALYLKQYYITFPEKMKEKSKKSRAAHHEELVEWRTTHREEINEYARKYKAEHREEGIAKRRKLRQEVLEHYGGKCVCCGETTYEFLTFDHISGNGAEHRKNTKAKRLGDWLRINDYPSGFQVLCYNCNCAKGQGGTCPHQKVKENDEQTTTGSNSDSSCVVAGHAITQK